MASLPYAVQQMLGVLQACALPAHTALRIEVCPWVTVYLQLAELCLAPDQLPDAAGFGGPQQQ